MDNIVKKAGKRIYMPYQLKRAGVNQADLVTIYISVVRPVVEYPCPVWSSNLPVYLSDNIEMIQKRAVSRGVALGRQRRRSRTITSPEC